MTEERIKELIETYPITEQELITLVRTVAAETRDGGIDELRDSLERYGDIAFRAQQEAERLKEKGK